MKRQFLLLALCLGISGHAAADFSGRVVKVADGDTVTVLDAGKQQVRVRLASIDAPEKRQAFGTRSQQHLSTLVFGKDVQVIEQGRDRYGRTIGVLRVGNSNINRAMVSAGLAWAYTDYLNDKAMPGYEQRARQARRGLWADPAPVPPWQFRRDEAEARRVKKAQAQIISIGAGTH